MRDENLQPPQFEQYLDLLSVPGGGESVELRGSQLVAARSRTTFDIETGVPQMLTAPYDVEVAELYDAKAGSGNFEHSTVGYRSALHYRHITAAFADFLVEFGDESVVADVGCGHGQLSATLAKRLPVFGVDLSNNMLRAAADEGLIPIRADAFALPFRDGVLDGIVSAEVIQHIENLDEFLGEFVRVTRPGGVLIMSTLNGNSLLRRLNRFVRGSDHSQRTKLRTARSFLDAASELPLELDRITWVLSPVPVTRSSSVPTSNWSWFAQNYVLRLRRV